MGIAITVVCTINAYSYTISEYLPNSQAALGYTGIVNGAVCAFQLTNADGGDFEQIFNTTSGLPLIEGVNCTVPNGGSVCTTGYITFSGAAFAQETIEIEQFYNGPNSGMINGTANWTYIALPPVPSQTPQPILTGDGISLLLGVSQWSQVYGYPLIGCVASAGLTPYSGGLAPATLSSNPSQNSIPNGAVAYYNNPPYVMENTTLLLSLINLYIAPNSTYDFHWVCYNAIGRSPDSLLFNVTASSKLPVPNYNNKPSSSAASSLSASSGTMAALVMGSLAVLLL